MHIDLAYRYMLKLQLQAMLIFIFKDYGDFVILTLFDIKNKKNIGSWS